MANYINTLQAENAALKATIARQEKDIAEFRAFLASSKFHNDTTIQVRDVDARLLAMWIGLTPGLAEGE